MDCAVSCSVSRFCVSPVVSSILEQKKSSDKTRDACIHFLITVVFELLCGIAILSGRRLLWCFVRSCRPVECQCSALHSENLLWFCRKPTLVFPKTCFGFSRNLTWFCVKAALVLFRFLFSEGSIFAVWVGKRRRLTAGERCFGVFTVFFVG